MLDTKMLNDFEFYCWCQRTCVYRFTCVHLNRAEQLNNKKLTFNWFQKEEEVKIITMRSLQFGFLLLLGCEYRWWWWWLCVHVNRTGFDWTAYARSNRIMNKSESNFEIFCLRVTCDPSDQIKLNFRFGNVHLFRWKNVKCKGQYLSQKQSEGWFSIHLLYESSSNYFSAQWDHLLRQPDIRSRVWLTTFTRSAKKKRNKKLRFHRLAVK